MKAYIVKLTFKDIQPEIWRRVILPAGATFNRLHETIQHVTNFQSRQEPYHYFAVNVEDLMITNNEALHEDYKGRKVGGRFLKQPSRLKIDGYLQKYGVLLYNYDFGDDWYIKVSLEEIVEDYYFAYPTLLEGDGVAPPEDVGGPPGYQEFLKVYHDPAHPDFLSTYAWAEQQRYKVLDDYEVNERLKSVKYKKTEWQHIHHDNYVVLSDKYRKTEFMKLEEHIDKELVIRYIAACVNLYGYIEHEDLLRIYNQQNERAISGTELRTVLINLGYPNPLHNHKIVLYQDAFVHQTIELLDDPAHFMQSIQGKPFYVPEKEELLRYEDYSYFEKTEHQDKLMNMMARDFFSESKLVVKVELHQLVKQLQIVDLNFNELVRKFLGRFVMDDMKQANEYIQAITRISNTTRIWENRGHTPSEISKMEKQTLKPLPKAPLQVVDVGKAGRNDSCPCGSGKKYKKCCGK
ncbi:plasmid pRiA4b ORF-3 family protein [Ureibacillus sp. GCM10028918]|uniref:plasmid pRiA4b ORF-3 family protein n=1 Tax=Ureibacillus sp. GCM10028918 TaxID=3273429 RepID=UPI0036128987